MLYYSVLYTLTREEVLDEESPRGWSWRLGMTLPVTASSVSIISGGRDPLSITGLTGSSGAAVVIIDGRLAMCSAADTLGRA